MNTKIFTITKTGYSTGVYGCTGEYFTAVFTQISEYKGVKELVFSSFTFEGLYGVEERVKDAFIKNGFVYGGYISANFGKLSKKDIYKNTKSETEAIQFINILQ